MFNITSYTDLDILDFEDLLGILPDSYDAIGNFGVFLTEDDLRSQVVNPEQNPLSFRIVATVLHAIILCVGIVGNIGTIHVVRKTKSMHTPTYCYLVSLAVADLIVIISACPEAIISHHLYRGQWILGQAGCSLLVFGNFLGINASSTSICCFTVERYVGVCHPLWARKFCSVRRAKKIIIGIWLFAGLYCAHWLGLTDIETYNFPGFPELHKCTFRLSREAYLSFFAIDICLFYVVPLLISIAVYTLIGVALKRSTTSQLTQTPNGSFRHERRRLGKQAIPKESTLQVIRMLIVVVASFAILWLPYRGLLVYNSIWAKEKFVDIWYLLFAKTLIYINSAINPILYSVCSRRFRLALLQTLISFFRLKKHRKRKTVVIRQVQNVKTWIYTPYQGPRPRPAVNSQEPMASISNSGSIPRRLNVGCRRYSDGIAFRSQLSLLRDYHDRQFPISV